MVKLGMALTDTLLLQPEFGMGYQRVEVQFSGEEAQQAIVYNAELLLLENEPRTILKTAAYTRLLAEAKAPEKRVESLRVIPPPAIRRYMLSVKEAGAGSNRGPATDGPEEKTKEGGVFKRFTAYEKDRRITAEGALLPGTYATTKEDARNVRTGKDAVARYALPNPQPASYRFAIRPLRNTVFQQGIVQPANDQPGGGVEVIFTRGTDDRTLDRPPDKIPDE